MNSKTYPEARGCLVPALLLIIFSLFVFSCDSEPKLYCTEGLLLPSGYQTYYSELPEASDIIIDFDGIIGEFYVTQISKCSSGFCVENYKLGELHFTGSSYILENGCHTPF